MMINLIRATNIFKLSLLIVSYYSSNKYLKKDFTWLSPLIITLKLFITLAEKGEGI